MTEQEIETPPSQDSAMNPAVVCGMVLGAASLPIPWTAIPIAGAIFSAIGLALSKPGKTTYGIIALIVNLAFVAVRLY